MAAATIVIPARRYAFFAMTHQFAAGEITLALTAGQVGAKDSVIIDSTYDFTVVARSCIHNSPLNTSGQGKYQRQVDRRILNSGGAGLGGFAYLSGFGNGTAPHSPVYERRPFVIRGGSNFVMIVDDRQLVGSPITARFLHWGWVTRQTIAPKRLYAEDEPLELVADFTAEGPNGASVAANATQTLPVQMDQDADFEVAKLVLLSDGEFKLQIKQNETRNVWFHKPVHGWLLGATAIDSPSPSGAWPFLMPCVDEAGQRYYTEILSGRHSYSVTVQDLSGQANRIQIKFIGRRLVPRGGLAVAA